MSSATATYPTTTSTHYEPQSSEAVQEMLGEIGVDVDTGVIDEWDEGQNIGTQMWASNVHAQAAPVKFGEILGEAAGYRETDVRIPDHLRPWLTESQKACPVTQARIFLNGQQETNEVTALQAKVEELTGQVDRLQRKRKELRGLAGVMDDCTATVEACKTKTKNATKALEAATNNLHAASKRDVDQGELPLKYDDDDEKESTVPKLVEAASKLGLIPLVDVRVQLGGKTVKFAKGWLEKLAGQDVRNIEHLEAFIAAGNFVPGLVKGIGQTAVDKMEDILVEFRREHPVPAAETVDAEVSEETDEPDNGQPSEPQDDPPLEPPF